MSAKQVIEELRDYLTREIKEVKNEYRSSGYTDFHAQQIALEDALTYLQELEQKYCKEPQAEGTIINKNEGKNGNLHSKKNNN